MKRRVAGTLIFIIFVGMSNAQMQNNASLAGNLLANSNETLDLRNDPFEKVSDLDVFLAASQNSLSDKETYKNEFFQFVEKLKNKNSRDQKYFLKNLFYKVHNKYLKHYENYVSFDDIFENGNYDCVTGTALYALILNELGYTFQIYESNFHVLLMVNLENDLVLFESTDFYEGFIDNKKQIEERILYYETRNSEKSDTYYSYQVDNNRVINPRQLAGLLFFNLAVEQYNLQNLKQADNYLDKAEFLYRSNRTKELRDLIEKAGLYNIPLSLNQ